MDSIQWFEYFSISLNNKATHTLGAGQGPTIDRWAGLLRMSAFGALAVILNSVYKVSHKFEHQVALFALVTNLIRIRLAS